MVQGNFTKMWHLNTGGKDEHGLAGLAGEVRRIEVRHGGMRWGTRMVPSVLSWLRVGWKQGR